MVAGLLALVVVAGACSNASGAAGGGGGGSGAPGLTATEVDVGSLGNISGPVNADFAPIVKGVQAYFDMVNAEGGVNGRKLVLKYQLDDQGIPTQDANLARTLVTQDHVFAVVGVGTPFFSGAKYLAQQGTPTYGYEVSSDWAAGPNLFGQQGSYIDFTTLYGSDAWFAHSIGAHSAAVVAYGITASSAGCKLAADALQKFGFPVVYQDLAVGFGADLGPDALQIKQHGADLVASCLDLNGDIALARAMQQNGVSAKQLWFNGNDKDSLKAYPTLMNGVYFLDQQVPFAAASQFPGVYPGLEQYISTMQKYEPDAVYNETALDGWLNADLFVTGLRAAGKNPTQAQVVAADNKLTDYNGGGLIPPVNWTVSHTTSPGPACAAFIQADAASDSFKPVLGTGSSVFVCHGATSTTPVSGPTGLPGG
ncbi:MAG TPA: ABC transporter substrate-binding protein [Acidimicrobiales bacterium]|nr:ABC transporter substrate-binding protein [Acidimicrobiales bacterium]